MSHELVGLLFNSLSACIPSGLLETGLQEGVVVAGVGVVEEDGAWAEETALTPAGSETLTDTAEVTNRESVLTPPTRPKQTPESTDLCRGFLLVTLFLFGL